MNFEDLINKFGKNKKVNSSDENFFIGILKNFISIGDIKALFHLATFQNIDCAEKIFSLTDIAIIIAGVAYVIFPFDAIPDFIPITGYLDDIGVIKFILSTYGNLIKKYREKCMC